MDAVKYHSQLASAWEKKYNKNRSFIARERLLIEILKSAVNLDDSWLDAGCGTGYFTRALKRLGADKVIGLDGSADMLHIAEGLTSARDKKEEITFSQCSGFNKLGYSDCSFDGVFCSSVLEYLENPEAAIKEFRRVLKPGGRLVITLPNRFALVRRFEQGCFYLTKWLLRKPWPQYLSFVKNQYSVKQASSLILDSKFSLSHLGFGGLGVGPARIDRMKYWGPLIFIIAIKK